MSNIKMITCSLKCGHWDSLGLHLRFSLFPCWTELLFITPFAWIYNSEIKTLEVFLGLDKIPPFLIPNETANIFGSIIFWLQLPRGLSQSALCLCSLERFFGSEGSVFSLTLAVLCVVRTCDIFLCSLQFPVISQSSCLELPCVWIRSRWSFVFSVFRGWGGYSDSRRCQL